MVKDPVCGMEIDENKSIKKEYKRRTYHFCNPSCQWAFENNPEQFAK